jgi:hypothetical protein
VLEDKVEYSDSSPWPAGADGFGLSLQRRLATAYGNDPTNWLAALPTAAAPTTTGAASPPVILVGPQSQSALAFQDVMLSVSAVGSAPLNFQWRHNGANLVGATNSVLRLPSVQPAQGGDYQVLVYNAVGSVVSTNAQLMLSFPAAILAQPQSAKVYVRPDPQAAANPTATFSVLANSSSPLRYQWRFNGSDIPAATNSTLIITNVQLTSGGEFSVVVTDDIGPILSAPAILYPLVSPTIVQGPVSQMVAAGATVTLSAVAAGNPLPFSFEWRRGSTSVVTNTVNATNNFFTFTASTVPFTTNMYRVVVRNLANQGITANSVAVIITLADNDHDGIPDAYEEVLGLNTNDLADASGDLDQDGMSNLDEYRAGTDPLDPAGNLRLDSMITPGVALLQLLAVSNRTYTIQFTDGLRTRPWTRLIDINARTNNHLEQIRDPNWTTNRFYRVITPQQP